MATGRAQSSRRLSPEARIPTFGFQGPRSCRTSYLFFSRLDRGWLRRRLCGQPFRKSLVFSERDFQSLAQDVIAVTVQILAVLFESAHQSLVKFSLDAFALVFWLLRHVRFH